MTHLIKALCFTLLFTLATQTIEAQQAKPDLPNPFEIYQKGLNENNYLQPLLELERNEAEYMRSPMWSGLVPDLLAYLNSYVGRYEKGYAYLDKRFEKQLKPQPDLQSSPIDEYEMRDALRSIVSIAEKQQVVMINEEHDAPIHRAFTTRLLPHLYAKGFRYLAAETLGGDSETLNKRGYPVQNTGFYSVDPVFGDMLRYALELGFTLVWYEHQERCVPPADKPNACQEARERGQAQNLYNNIFKADPDAKVLVHVGRGHNQKLKFDDWAMMAWHFREISKIEPFSINQMMSERSEPGFERPEYRYVTKTRKFAQPVVFQAKTGEWHKGNGFDLVVFHPRTQYTMGRPDWLKMDGRRKPVEIPKKLRPKTNGIYLVQAFVQGESADAIPVDQIIVSPGQPVPVLMLPKGSFNLRTMDESGKVVTQGTQKVR